jgi:hypothetical protein
VPLNAHGTVLPGWQPAVPTTCPINRKWYWTVPLSFLPLEVFATIFTGHALRALGVWVGTDILAVHLALEWALEPSAGAVTPSVRTQERATSEPERITPSS